MIIDSELVLSDAQAITASAASTNYYDFGAAGAGEGNPLRAVVHVNTTFDNLTSLALALQCDDNTSFSSAKTLTSRSIVLASLVANKKIDLGVVPSECERYLRAYYTVTGTNPAAGALTMFLTPYGGDTLEGAML